MSEIKAALNVGDGGNPEVFMVSNVIQADDQNIPQGYVACPDAAQIGDIFDGTNYTTPVVAPIPLVQVDFERVVQEHLDARAHTFDFDNIFTGVSYADEPAVTKFQDEGKALRTWRSLVWEKCYDVLQDVEAGTVTLNTTQDLIDLLPDFVDPVYT